MNHDDSSSHGDLPVPRTGATGPTGSGRPNTTGGMPGTSGTSSTSGASSSNGDVGARDRFGATGASLGADDMSDLKDRARDFAGTAQDRFADMGDAVRSRAGQFKDSAAGRKVADGMAASAEWLRNADLDDMRDGLETQVRRHPGLTLLVAAGLGFLLGKAFRD